MFFSGLHSVSVSRLCSSLHSGGAPFHCCLSLSMENPALTFYWFSGVRNHHLCFRLTLGLLPDPSLVCRWVLWMGGVGAAVVHSVHWKSLTPYSWNEGTAPHDRCPCRLSVVPQRKMASVVLSGLILTSVYLSSKCSRPSWLEEKKKGIVNSHLLANV